MDDLFTLLMERLGGLVTPSPTTNLADGIRNPWNMGSLPGGGLSPTGYPLSTPQGQAEQVSAGNPNMSPMDVVKQTPDQIMESATNTPDLGAALGKLGTSLGGSTAAAQTHSAPAVTMPNYGGGGGYHQGGQTISPMNMMMAMKMPTGGVGAPLGPASANPLLMMLRARLGIN